MNKKLILLTILLCSVLADIFAQKNAAHIFEDSLVKPRMRIIIDNDFGGDPDGLFELVQHLLSPSVDIRAIIGSHLRAGDGFDPSKETAANAKMKIEEVLSIMNLGKTYPVYQDRMLL
ncbi:MAG: hypothetical protein ABI921_13035 [Panacibacter sp.]